MKQMIIITCCSFTAIMLLFALFTALGLEGMAPEITRTVMLQAFLMSVSMAIMMSICDKIVTRFVTMPLLVDVLIRIVICYMVVFAEGCLFGMIPLSWKSFLDISPVLIVVFFVTYLICYMTQVEYAQQINKSIRRKK